MAEGKMKLKWLGEPSVVVGFQDPARMFPGKFIKTGDEITVPASTGEILKANDAHWEVVGKKEDKPEEPPVEAPAAPLKPKGPAK
ncbi:hypothetical protein CCP3SC15_2270003 [Gammaproteobacteria bacterium]